MRKLMTLVVAGVLSLGAAPAWANHDRGGECDEYGCYDNGDGYDQSYDQWNGNDRNRNRNRNRGAFSPGPFDDSPVDAFNGNVICLPGSTCYTDDKKKDEQPPE